MKPIKSIFVALGWMAVTSTLTLAILAFFAFFSFDTNKIKTTFWPKNSNSLSLLQVGDNGNQTEYVNQDGTQVLGSQTAIVASDARAVIVANFLKRYNSSKAEGGFRDLDHPLVPEDYFGEFFVQLADKYGMDFRLLPAIAMQESNLCKVTPKTYNPDGSVRESYNCLGFGVYGDKVAHFPNFEANFEAAAKTLKKHYIDKGLDTPYKIMRKYTPPSDGSWAESVNQWMAEMRYDDRASGKTYKTDADLWEFVDGASGSAGVKTSTASALPSSQNATASAN